MQNKNAFLIIVVVLLISLACQTLTQPASTSSEDITPQSTVSSVTTFSPLTGLVYGTHDEATDERAVWQIGENDAPYMLLSGYSYAEFSPDGTQAVYYDKVFETGSGCTWLADFAGEEIRPLDCIASLSEVEPSFPASILGWTQNDPDTLVAILNQTGGGMGGSWGYLGTLSKDGTKKIIDPDHAIQDAKVSPSGQFIAYDSYDVKSFQSLGWLYSTNTGVTQFDPKDYGVNYLQIGNPSWSPDEKRIAWGLMGDEFNSAIGVFDLESKTAKILQTYRQSIVTDMRPTPPSSVWNSDGQWLIVEINAQGENGQYDIDQSGDWLFSADGDEKYKVDGDFVGFSPDNNWVLYIRREADKLELWVSRPDGSQKTHIGETADFDNSIWSGDGRYLAFVDGGHAIQYVETGVWQPITATGIEASSNISLLGWLAPIQSSFETMTVLSTPTAKPFFSCPNAPRTRLQVGATARVTYTDGSTIRLRSAPEAGDNVIDQLPEGTEFEIVDGPVCTPRLERSDSYVYWKVTAHARNGVTGWVAEGDAKAYYIEPWP